MIETTRLELTVPISEEDLLEFLLSGYPQEQLTRLGIGPSNCIIRDVRIEHDVEAGSPKCNFRVASLTVVNTEEILEQAEEAQKRVIEQLGKREKALKEEVAALASSPEVPKPSTRGGCVKKQILEHQTAMKVSKQKKPSNS